MLFIQDCHNNRSIHFPGLAYFTLYTIFLQTRKQLLTKALVIISLKLIVMKVFIGITLIFLLLAAFSISPSIKAADSYSVWNPVIDLPYPLASHAVTRIDNRVYVLGGGDAVDYRSEIYSADVDTGGSLSPWAYRGELPLDLIWHNIQMVNSRMYLLGGAKKDPTINSISSLNTVYLAQLNSTGDIIGWIPQANLPMSLARGGTFTFNNRLYYVGGLVRQSNNSVESVVSGVYMTDVNSDGSINNWSSVSSLPQPRAEFAVFLVGNRVFIVGGMNPNSTPANSVYVGTINEITGNIDWQVHSNLPTGLRRPAYSQMENTAFLIGGYDGTSFTKKTYIKDLTNQSIEWTEINPELLQGNCCNGAISYNRFLYLIGGHDGVSYFSSVLKMDILTSSKVPNLKQFDTQWKNMEYDSAAEWSRGKDTIERWGCAITSAAMILSYHGHRVNPDGLNNWLKNNNGYIAEGLVDWSAITRYAKLSNDINPLLPKLEYKRYQPFETEKLDIELENNRPVILKTVRPNDQGTHFIVVSEKIDNDYKINDPSTNYSLLSQYPSIQYNRIDAFVPSQTDLSYLYLYTDNNTKLSVYLPDGSQINEGFTVENPLIDQTNQEIGPQKTLNSFSLAKPISSAYIFRVSGNNRYKIVSRIYDNEAVLTELSQTAFLEKNTIDTYLFTVSKPSKMQIIDFDFVKQNLKEAYNSRQIKNRNLYLLLKASVEAAEKFYLKKKLLYARQTLDATRTIIQVSKKQLTQDYYIGILAYIKYLKESI